MPYLSVLPKPWGIIFKKKYWHELKHFCESDSINERLASVNAIVFPAVGNEDKNTARKR